MLLDIERTLECLKYEAGARRSETRRRLTGDEGDDGNPPPALPCGGGEAAMEFKLDVLSLGGLNGEEGSFGGGTGFAETETFSFFWLFFGEAGGAACFAKGLPWGLVCSCLSVFFLKRNIATENMWKAKGKATKVWSIKEPKWRAWRAKDKKKKKTEK